MYIHIYRYNILLDQNFNAKLADFGLEVSIPAVIGNTSVMSVNDGIRLTKNRGYIAPEFNDGERNVKADIFSYGVVSRCVIIIIICLYNIIYMNSMPR